MVQDAQLQQLAVKNDKHAPIVVSILIPLFSPKQFIVKSFANLEVGKEMRGSDGTVVTVKLLILNALSATTASLTVVVVDKYGAPFYRIYTFIYFLCKIGVGDPTSEVYLHLTQLFDDEAVAPGAAPLLKNI